MPIDKKTLVPGSLIKVTRLKANTAGIVTDMKTLSGLTLRDLTANSVVATAVIGDLLTVIKKPRAQFGINVCRVKTAAGVEGEVYWTELKSNCEMA